MESKTTTKCYNIMEGERTFKLLSSLLVFFRASCPTGKVRVNYSSIVSPFTGSREVLEGDKIVHSLASCGVKPIKCHKPKLLRPSSKAGPNGNNAILSMGIDLLA